jgi:hypothetical protein
MTTERFQHPEAQPGEVWMANLWSVDFKHVGWTTKRLGRATFDSSGTPIGGGMRPVFISRAEVVAAGVEIPIVGAIDHRW